jgi:hypothetical protein
MIAELPDDYENFKASIFDTSADPLGVYEVLTAANRDYPSLPLSQRLAVAETVVSDLLAEGRVALVRGKWIGPEHHHEVVPDPVAALREWATWAPQPEDETVVWLLAAD